MANMILKQNGQIYCLNVLTMVGLMYGAEVRLGIILPAKETYPWALSKTVPAIEYAIETVMNNSQLLTNYKLVLNERDSKCSETLGPLAAIDMYVEKSAHVFIGPVCDYAVAPIARFSSHWRIPVITAGALVNAFKDKSEYKLLTRIQGSYAKAGEFFLDMFRIFNWTKVGLMFHDNIRSPNRGKSNCFFTMEAVYYTIQREFSIEPWNEDFDERSEDVDFDELLKQASQNTRIVVLCASADSVRDIMIKAHELNFDNGEYVFFNIDLFSSNNESERPWYRSHDTEERNMKAQKAYESLMTVTLRKPTSPEYKRFSEEVKRRARAKYPNFTYGEEEVNSFVGAFHDAVILYALALNETLEADMSISDGEAITRRMWNRTFDGITGTVSIDENGDRNADYSLLDMNPATKEFEVVANYYGNTRQYKPVPGKQIYWAGGRTSPPPDTPKCGFDGSKCPPEKPFPEYGIVIIVLGSLLLIVLVAAFFIYRHVKLEADLAEMNWRVKWEDIMFGTLEADKKLKRQGSTLSLTHTEDSNHEGRILIERTDEEENRCKCGNCEAPNPQKRVCCHHVKKQIKDMNNDHCITLSKDFDDIVLNPAILLVVYIHVMLTKKQKGQAPFALSPRKYRTMATRQYLCWIHKGKEIKKEGLLVVPSCVTRAIRRTFPENTSSSDVPTTDDVTDVSI